MLRLISLALLLIGLLLFRYFQTRPIYKENDQVKITATLTEMPAVTTDPYDNTQQKFRLLGITVYTPLFPSYSYGDRLEITGQVKKGKSGYWLKIENITSLPTHPLLSRIGHFRARLENLIHSYLPPPHSSLVAGMVLGSKNLPPVFYEQLKNSGTLHVVVASGTNITLLVSPFMEILLLFLNRRLAAIIVILLIWFYAFLVGFEPPILRASFMASLTFLALLLGRRTWAWWSLFISAYILLLINPQFLHDLGFQLSFLATAGILGLAPPLKRFFKFLPSFFHESWCMTLAAQIATFPVLIFAFHRFQPLSPLINGILLWTIPWITSLGMLSLLLGLLWYPLGRLLTYLIYPLTTIFTSLVSLF